MRKRIKVKPKAKQQRLIHEDDGSLTVHLKSSPVDGKANAELIKLLAKEFGVTQSQITLKSGLSSRQKLVDIQTED